MFLQLFFPLKDLPKDGFGEAFANPPLLWMLVFRHLMRPYGLFIIATIIAERRCIFPYLTAAIKSVPDIYAAGSLTEVLNFGEARQAQASDW